MASASQRTSIATPSKQSLLSKNNDSTRIPNQVPRISPTNPVPDVVSRVKGTPLQSFADESTRGTPSIAAMAISPTPHEDNVSICSTPSTVSLPPLTPKRVPMARVFSIDPALQDGFTQREIALVNELNSLRKSPKHYADRMALVMELHEPFVSHKRMTYRELLQFVSEKTEEKLSLEKTLEEMDVREKDEKASLQARWAVEDAERAKKNKKTAISTSNKKRGSVAADEQLSFMTERTTALDEVGKRYEAGRSQAKNSLHLVSAELHKASHGVKFVSFCFRKVGSTQPLPELKYDRGLSLGARDGCLRPQCDNSVASTLARRYGSGRHYGIAQFCGEETASQTVMEMLLGRNDSGFVSRQALLSPEFDSVGCGWRSSNSGETVSTFLLSSLFEDLQAISNRPFVPLSQLKHELPNAVRETPGTAVGIHGDFGIEILEPKYHPIRCGNVVRMVFRCVNGVQLCGVVSHVSEVEPSAPAHGDGQSFSHRLDVDTVELFIVLPFRSDFNVSLFASNPGFSSGYSRVGKISVASYDWNPVESAATLPIASGDFLKRNARLISPMFGTLAPLSLQKFEVVVPFSNYLMDELSVIESELLAIESKHEDSGASLEELELSAANARQQFLEVEAQCNKQIQLLDEGIQAIVREAARKRGKETKSKTAQADLEEQRRTEEQQIAAALKAVEEASSRVEAFRRSARQISAQKKRLTSERENLRQAMSRSQPLLVEISLGDRRAVMNVVPNTNATCYSLSLRVPKEGRVCMYVNGLLQLTWLVGDN